MDSHSSPRRGRSPKLTKLYKFIESTYRALRKFTANMGSIESEGLELIEILNKYKCGCFQVYEEVLENAELCGKFASNICRTLDIFKQLYNYPINCDEFYHRVAELLSIFIAMELRLSLDADDELIERRIVYNMRRFLTVDGDEEASQYNILLTLMYIPRLFNARRIMCNVMQAFIPFTSMPAEVLQLPDRLYILHIIVFYRWLMLEQSQCTKDLIITYASRYMKPQLTLCNNKLYVDHLPAYTTHSTATKTILSNLKMYRDIRNASIIDNAYKNPGAVVNLCDDDEDVLILDEPNDALNFAQLFVAAQMNAKESLLNLKIVKREQDTIVDSVDLTEEEDGESDAMLHSCQHEAWLHRFQMMTKQFRQCQKRLRQKDKMLWQKAINLDSEDTSSTEEEHANVIMASPPTNKMTKHQDQTSMTTGRTKSSAAANRCQQNEELFADNYPITSTPVNSLQEKKTESASESTEDDGVTLSQRVLPSPLRTYGSKKPRNETDNTQRDQKTSPSSPSVSAPANNYPASPAFVPEGPNSNGSLRCNIQFDAFDRFLLTKQNPLSLQTKPSQATASLFCNIFTQGSTAAHKSKCLSGCDLYSSTAARPLLSPSKLTDVQSKKRSNKIQDLMQRRATLSCRSDFDDYMVALEAANRDAAMQDHSIISDVSQTLGAPLHDSITNSKDDEITITNWSQFQDEKLRNPCSVIIEPSEELIQYEERMRALLYNELLQKQRRKLELRAIEKMKEKERRRQEKQEKRERYMREQTDAMLQLQRMHIHCGSDKEGKSSKQSPTEAVKNGNTNCKTSAANTMTTQAESVHETQPETAAVVGPLGSGAEPTNTGNKKGKQSPLNKCRRKRRASSMVRETTLNNANESLDKEVTEVCTPHEQQPQTDSVVGPYSGGAESTNVGNKKDKQLPLKKCRRKRRASSMVRETTFNNQQDSSDEEVTEVYTRQLRPRLASTSSPSILRTRRQSTASPKAVNANIKTIKASTKKIISNPVSNATQTETDAVEEKQKVMKTDENQKESAKILNTVDTAQTEGDKDVPLLCTNSQEDTSEIRKTPIPLRRSMRERRNSVYPYANNNQKDRSLSNTAAAVNDSICASKDQLRVVTNETNAQVTSCDEKSLAELSIVANIAQRLSSPETITVVQKTPMESAEQEEILDTIEDLLQKEARREQIDCCKGTIASKGQTAEEIENIKVLPSATNKIQHKSNEHLETIPINTSNDNLLIVMPATNKIPQKSNGHLETPHSNTLNGSKIILSETNKVPQKSNDNVKVIHSPGTNKITEKFSGYLETIPVITLNGSSLQVISSETNEAHRKSNGRIEEGFSNTLNARGQQVILSETNNITQASNEHLENIPNIIANETVQVIASKSNNIPQKTNEHLENIPNIISNENVQVIALETNNIPQKTYGLLENIPNIILNESVEVISSEPNTIPQKANKHIEARPQNILNDCYIQKSLNVEHSDEGKSSLSSLSATVRDDLNASSPSNHNIKPSSFSETFKQHSEKPLLVTENILLTAQLTNGTTATSVEKAVSLINNDIPNVSAPAAAVVDLQETGSTDSPHALLLSGHNKTIGLDNGNTSTTVECGSSPRESLEMEEPLSIRIQEEAGVPICVEGYAGPAALTNGEDFTAVNNNFKQVIVANHYGEAEQPTGSVANHVEEPQQQYAHEMECLKDAASDDAQPSPSVDEDQYQHLAQPQATWQQHEETIMDENDDTQCDASWEDAGKNDQTQDTLVNVSAMHYESLVIEKCTFEFSSTEPRFCGPSILKSSAINNHPAQATKGKKNVSFNLMAEVIRVPSDYDKRVPVFEKSDSTDSENNDYVKPKQTQQKRRFVTPAKRKHFDADFKLQNHIKSDEPMEEEEGQTSSSDSGAKKQSVLIKRVVLVPPKARPPDNCVTQLNLNDSDEQSSDTAAQEQPSKEKPINENQLPFFIISNELGNIMPANHLLRQQEQLGSRAIVSNTQSFPSSQITLMMSPSEQEVSSTQETQIPSVATNYASIDCKDTGISVLLQNNQVDTTESIAEPSNCLPENAGSLSPTTTYKDDLVPKQHLNVVAMQSTGILETNISGSPFVVGPLSPKQTKTAVIVKESSVEKLAYMPTTMPFQPIQREPDYKAPVNIIKLNPQTLQILPETQITPLRAATTFAGQRSDEGNATTGACMPVKQLRESMTKIHPTSQNLLSEPVKSALTGAIVAGPGIQTTPVIRAVRLVKRQPSVIDFQEFEFSGSEQQGEKHLNKTLEQYLDTGDNEITLATKSNKVKGSRQRSNKQRQSCEAAKEGFEEVEKVAGERKRKKSSKTEKEEKKVRKKKEELSKDAKILKHKQSSSHHGDMTPANILSPKALDEETLITIDCQSRNKAKLNNDNIDYLIPDNEKSAKHKTSKDKKVISKHKTSKSKIKETDSKRNKKSDKLKKDDNIKALPGQSKRSQCLTEETEITRETPEADRKIYLPKVSLSGAEDILILNSAKNDDLDLDLKKMLSKKGKLEKRKARLEHCQNAREIKKMKQALEHQGSEILSVPPLDKDVQTTKVNDIFKNLKAAKSDKSKDISKEKSYRKEKSHKKSKPQALHAVEQPLTREDMKTPSSLIGFAEDSQSSAVQYSKSEDLATFSFTPPLPESKSSASPRDSPINSLRRRQRIL